MRASASETLLEVFDAFNDWKRDPFDTARGRRLEDAMTGLPMALSQMARAYGLAQAMAVCPDDVHVAGVREGAAEIAQLLGGDA